MEQIITYAYIIISLLFTLNFFNVWKQLKSGSKKVNSMSLLATSSLVFQFAALAYFFATHDLTLIFITQVYMLSCMLYMKFIYKKDKG